MRRRLTRVALAILDSPMLAEEIVQEAYLRLLITEAGAVRCPSSWLVTVTRNLALDQARRRSHEQKLLLLLQRPDSSERHDDRHATVSQLVEIISRLIAASDSHVTAILLLHIVFDMSYEELASICGRSSAACRQAGRRALHKYRKAIHVDEPGEKTATTDMYVHAILEATMAPLIDSLSETTPAGMQRLAVLYSGEASSGLPAKAGRTRQVLVLTASGVKWALILDAMVLCLFDSAEFAQIIKDPEYACSINNANLSSNLTISV